MKKRILSTFLAAILVIGLLPMAMFAMTNKVAAAGGNTLYLGTNPENYGFWTLSGDSTPITCLTDIPEGAIVYFYYASSVESDISIFSSDWSETYYELQFHMDTDASFLGWSISHMAAVTDGMTLNACFEAPAPTYTVTYKDKDGETFSGTHEDDYPTSHTYGTETALKGATKEGFTFGGWFTAADCSGNPVTTLGATAYNADITLYAKWEKVIPSIRFEIVGSGSIELDTNYWEPQWTPVGSEAIVTFAGAGYFAANVSNLLLLSDDLYENFWQFRAVPAPGYRLAGWNPSTTTEKYMLNGCETVTVFFEEIPHVHNPEKVDGQAATESSSGWKDYYACDCGECYEDAAGSSVIEDLNAWKAQGGNGYIPSGNEINAAKTAAKATLDAENAKDPLIDEAALANGKNSIGSAATLAEIENVKSAAIAAIRQAQASELAAAKTAAKAALDAEEAKAPLTDKTSLTNGKSGIDGAATKAAVASAKNAAVAAIQQAQADEHEEPTSPETGDRGSVILVMLLALSSAGLGTLVIRKKKKNEQ